MFLQRRDKAPGVAHAGELSAFGGRVEIGETPRETLARELNEELELVVAPSELQFLTFVSHLDPAQGKLIQATYFLVQRPPGDLRCHEGSLYKDSIGEAIRHPLVGPITRAALETIGANPSLSRAEMSREERVLAIQTCLAYATYESSVYWQRNAIYLALNSVLLGGLAVVYAYWTPYILVAVGLLGSGFNWRWRHVNEYSKYLAERWREDARSIAAEDTALRQAFAALVGKSTLPKPSGPLPSAVMNSMAASFRYVWLLVLAGGVLWIIAFFFSTSPSEPPQEPEPSRPAISVTSTSILPNLQPPTTRESQTPAVLSTNRDGRR